MGSPYKTVAFHTLGCKLNYAETSSLARDFINSGYATVNFQDSADVYVINSCSVTDNADKKTRKTVRQALKRSPSAKVAIIGCYAQLKPEEIAQIPGVTLVVGAEEKFKLSRHIEISEPSGSPTIIKSDIRNVNFFYPSYSMGKRTRSFLKIQDGCNYTCSFCTIPLARGNSRSSTVKQTVSMAEKIAAGDTCEVVLTGVNVGDFGVLNGETLIDLIRALDKVKGINRFRISSIEPNLLTNEIIRFVGESEKFLPHFHIPLQSGSNTILKAMRRRYQINLFAERIHTIKSILPDAGIGVDIIVGFPGESKNHFQQTCDFLETIDVSYLHVFSYSQRDHTDAVNILPKVKPETIMERNQILRSLSRKKNNKFHQLNVGSVREVLIENYEAGFISGLTENYIRVRTEGKLEEVNSIIPLKMRFSHAYEMIGQRID